MIKTCVWSMVGLSSDRQPKERPNRVSIGGSDKYPNQGGNATGHESITELFEGEIRSRVSGCGVVPDAGCQRVDVSDRRVHRRYRAGGGVKQRLADCAGRMATESGLAIERNASHNRADGSGAGFGADPAYPQPQRQTAELRLVADQAIPSAT